MAMTRSPVFLLWGGMDALFILGMLWSSVSQGRVPIYSDIVAFRQLDDPGGYALALVGISLALILSIALSAWSLLTCQRFARVLAYAQTPFRIAMAVPSVTALPWVLNIMDSRSAALNIVLLIGSETLKVYTLYCDGRARQPTPLP